MKKIKYLLFSLLFFTFCFDVNATTFDKVTMDIYIDKNATAHITETWSGTFDEDTELYKVYNNLGNSEITNFRVSMNGIEFTPITWNLNASFSEKAYKSGINYTSDGLELCYGISRYGTNTYTMKYDITNFVVDATDKQVIYWNLIDQEFNSYQIKIYSDFRYSHDLPVWGYGNYGGLAYVDSDDGAIYLSDDTGLDDGEYVVVLASFNKGTFNTNVVLENDFSNYLDMAEEGATSYKNKISFFEIIMTIISFAIPVLIVIFFVLYIIFGGEKYTFIGNKKIPKDVNYFRDIPCNKDIKRAYFLAKKNNLMSKQTDFLGCILLKWIKENKVVITKEKEDGLFKKDANVIVFDLNNKPTDENELKLFDMMYKASKDGQLEKNEFKTWCGNNYQKIYDWFEECYNDEKQFLIDNHFIEKTKEKKFIFTKKVFIMNDSLYTETIYLKGLKKYFNEFTRMHEKMPIEVHLWQDYLIFAQLFGVADKVAKEFKNLYPDVLTDDTYDDIIFLHTVSHTGISSASSARAKAQSYSSGGGGFSSGGGGGGSFGGGGGGSR